MKKRKGVLLFLAAGIFILAGCGPKNIQPLEGRILFCVKEAYIGAAEGVEPTLYLFMETEKIYPCMNYSIEADIELQGTALNVDIRGVYQPEICLTALGPAVKGEFLKMEDGVYSLKFRNGPVFQSSYEVSIADDAVIVTEFSGQTFTLPKFNVWWRYPRNSFAVICGTTTETAWVFEDFLGRLQAGVDLVAHEFPPHGEIGYPRAPQGHQINHPSRCFIHEGDADFAAAGEILREYVRDVIGGMTGVSIWLLNWKNESFRSWTMAPAP